MNSISVAVACEEDTFKDPVNFLEKYAFSSFAVFQ